MSTLQLENIKHPDASGNALELGADGSIKVNSNIKNNAAYYANTIAESYNPMMAFVIEQTRDGQTKGISLGAIGTPDKTSIQTFDTIDNSANDLSLNPLGGNVSLAKTGNGPRTESWTDGMFQRLTIENTLYQNASVIGTSAEGPNKVVWYNDTAAKWVSGVGISDHTTNYYSGGRHRFSRHYGDVITEHMRIDENGYVTAPKQPHIFGTPHTGVEASSGQATLFRVKTSRGLSFSNNRVTVPVAGVYMITYQTICQTNVGRYDTHVKINGVETTNGLNETNGDGYHQRTHAFCMYLNANDYITWHNARYYSTGGAFDPWTTASVTLLG